MLRGILFVLELKGSIGGLIVISLPCCYYHRSAQANRVIYREKPAGNLWEAMDWL